MKHFSLSMAFMLAISAYPGMAQVPLSPIETVKKVGDRVIANTPFEYQLTLPKKKEAFDFICLVDFARATPAGGSAVSFAYSNITAEKDTTISLQVSHQDALKVYVNNEEVYRKEATGAAVIIQQERDFVLQHSFKVRLLKGENPILLKSHYKQGNQWLVYLQPEGSLIEFSPVRGLSLGLRKQKGITPEVANLSQWLVLGPFAAQPSPLDAIYGPENGFKIGSLYAAKTGSISWTLPKIDVLADFYDSHPLWGTYYSYNYHAAGLAWAMSSLAAYTKEMKYDDHSRRYTDFILATKPFIQYQIEDLHAFRSAQHHLINTPLLDFTAAPALPFVQRLMLEPTKANIGAYKAFVGRTKTYVIKEQVRLPDGTFTRSTPEKYTTWVDDMFMGIPFLTFCALEAKDPKEKAAFFDEAVRQVIGFNANVYDKKANLYHHATYSAKASNIPHWSRANGWGVFAASVLLESLPISHPKRAQVLVIYTKHIEAIAKLQDRKTGFWHQVIDSPTTYNETSATGIFTMAMAKGVNNGWLKHGKYETAIRKGWEALTTQIEPDGTVHGICVGTMSSETEKYYAERPVADNDSHGLIGLIWAGIELDKYISKYGKL